MSGTVSGAFDVLGRPSPPELRATLLARGVEGAAALSVFDLTLALCEAMSLAKVRKAERGAS
jgi:hypothetical protein